MERVLVTGGSGFIGSHLAEALVKDGFQVRILDNLSTGRRQNLEGLLAAGVDFIQGDASDAEVAKTAVDGVAFVFHQAAIPSVPRSIKEPLHSHRNGPLATLNMLDASRAAGVRRFIFAASSSAYGNTATLPKREDMTPAPLSPYAVGKLTGEHYARVFSQTMGLDCVCLRYFNVFGPRQDPSSPYSGVISRFSEMMRRGERPVIYGDGGQTRDFTYVANAVHANLLAMRASKPLGGEVYNVGTGERISLLDLVDAVNEILGSRLEPIFQPQRDGDVRDSLASLDKINKDLGYQPLIGFLDGLRITLAD